MFTERHRETIIEALDNRVAGYNRSKSKNPRFAPIIDEDIKHIRETQHIVRSWATQEDTTKKK